MSSGVTLCVGKNEDMSRFSASFFFLAVYFPTARPNVTDEIVSKLDRESAGYAFDSRRRLTAVSGWLTAAQRDAAAALDYGATLKFLLYTRRSKPLRPVQLVHGDYPRLYDSGFRPRQDTVLLLHGWMDDWRADFNRAMTQACLLTADMNVLIVDWSGVFQLGYAGSVHAMHDVAHATSAFLRWLAAATGAAAGSLHVLGLGLGAHLGAAAARGLPAAPRLLTALDPTLYAVPRARALRASDARRTRALHTNGGVLGALQPAAHVDYYFNGGLMMPGCLLDNWCSHAKSYVYLAESIRAGRGSFLGYRCQLDGCLNYRYNSSDVSALDDVEGNATGLFHINTNSTPPYALYGSKVGLKIRGSETNKPKRTLR